LFCPTYAENHDSVKKVAEKRPGKFRAAENHDSRRKEAEKRPVDAVARHIAMTR